MNIDKIKTQKFFTSKELMKLLKISQPTFSRMVKEEKITKMGYGIYALPTFKIPAEDLDFAIACFKFGKSSVITGLSALFHYHLIDQAPSQIWVTVPTNTTNNNKLYHLMRTQLSVKHGIETHPHYRISSIERAIIEALKFATKIGPRIAIGAARLALKEGLTTEKKLGDMANKLGLRSTLTKYWESIVV